MVHAQLATGHRTGIEPVLLAAMVPARAGERVVEGGTGSGAALLCLARRVPGVLGLGVEIDPEQAGQARANIVANGFEGLSVLTGDLRTLAVEGRFDHAMANPPWHDPGSTVSGDAAREVARRAPDGLFLAWAQALVALLRHRGTLSLVSSTASLSACLSAMTAAGCGSHVLLPLWPRVGRAAKLVLLQGVRGGRGPSRVLPGLVLHADGGGPTSAAEAVLRGGQALDMGHRR